MYHPLQTIKDIGEQGLLKLLYQFCDRHLVGDDGAILDLPPHQSLVITTDVLVEGVHFSDRTTPPLQVGWRAAAANLSDLAAMGSTPLGITVGLSLQPDLEVNWVKQLYQGLIACLEPYKCKIIGGDITRSSVNTVAITALGYVLPERVIRRNLAQPEDLIVVTGLHGSSRAGLELLLHPDKQENLTEAEIKTLINAHQQPIPRLDVIEHLWQVTNNVSVAGMDSSDGLADAVLQICRASGVGANIELNAIPILPCLAKIAPEQVIEWALYGGEDFELVLVLPAQMAHNLVEVLGEKAAIIGKITTNNEVNLIDNNRVYPPRRLNIEEGFQHF